MGDRGGRQGRQCQPMATRGTPAKRMVCKKGLKYHSAELEGEARVRASSGHLAECSLPGSVGRLQVNGLLLLSGPNRSSSLLCRA